MGDMAYSYDRTAGVKEAADEIQFEDLPDDRKKFCEELESMDFTPMKIWEGIHGIVIECSVSGPQKTRMTKDMLKKLLRFSFFRWIDIDDRRTSFGV